MLKNEIFIDKSLAIIPARKGSKSIRYKNRLNINTKNLVQNTFDFVKKIKAIDFVCITSDDNYFLKKKFNNTFLIKRKVSIARDKSSLDEVVTDTLKKFLRYFGYLPTTIIILQPTSWFRNSNDLLDGLKKIKTKRRIFTIHPLNETLSNIFYKKNNKNKFLNTKRIDYKQGEKKLFFLDGNYFMFLTKEFLKNNKIFDKKFFSIETNFPNNLEIDSIQQYNQVKQLTKIFK